MSKKKILRVKADDNTMKNMYAKFSKIMGLIEKSEKSLRNRSINLLKLREGDKVLEIGFGRGSALIQISKIVGEKGEVYGIDLTPEMLEISQKNLVKHHISNVKIKQGDGRNLAYNKDYFDAVYISSTLELFDTPDIPVVLKEIKRVLKPEGKLCVVSIPKKNREKSLGVKLYEWSHRTFPKYASCRPIYLEDSIKNAGFKLLHTEVIGVLLPMKIVIANP